MSGMRAMIRDLGRRWMRVATLAGGGLLGCASVLMAADAGPTVPVVRVGVEDRSAIQITVYNRDLALVRERRRIRLGRGSSRLIWREVSTRVRPESAVLRSKDHPGAFEVIEQAFSLLPLSPETLLRSFVGRQVGVVRSHPTTGAETEEEAVLLSADNGVILKIGDRIETAAPGRIVYDRIPGELRDYPALNVLCTNDTVESQELELSYLTTGLQWQADYVAELNPEEDRLDLVGRVNVSNRSGTGFEDVRLRLVAGDIHQVSAGPPSPAPRFRAMAVADSRERAAVREEGISDYHIYSVAGSTHLSDGQTKQLGLLAARGVPVKKEYRVSGPEHQFRSPQSDLAQRVPVAVRLRIRNDQDSGLGLPLPAGTVRVYLNDSEGEAVFLGEDRTDHVSKGETLRLRLGNAFDVRAERRQTEYRKLGAVGKYRNASSIGFEIDIRNSRSTEVVVQVLEAIPGEWEITQEDHPHEKAAAHKAVWRVAVPASGHATLRYTVAVRF